ncbi:hypothetical protein GMRT_13193 [Giardia muris]|uniref:Uncharacterized protein n=1 Tax=Giardia muris TaxID=5742 RepID=A0A4Z1SYU1_GIAMU|nr:hypothetical protein GMRT_13193 [Giardia muris]|eukprot:TNJ28668.1 hypothetical protein GMRT_13193 [Giardia muris]
MSTAEMFDRPAAPQGTPGARSARVPTYVSHGDGAGVAGALLHVVQQALILRRLVLPPQPDPDDEPGAGLWLTALRTALEARDGDPVDLTPLAALVPGTDFSAVHTLLRQLPRTLRDALFGASCQACRTFSLVSGPACPTCGAPIPAPFLSVLPCQSDAAVSRCIEGPRRWLVALLTTATPALCIFARPGSGAPSRDRIYALFAPEGSAIRAESARAAELTYLRGERVAAYLLGGDEGARFRRKYGTPQVTIFLNPVYLAPQDRRILALSLDVPDIVSTTYPFVTGDSGYPHMEYYDETPLTHLHPPIGVDSVYNHTADLENSPGDVQVVPGNASMRRKDYLVGQSTLRTRVAVVEPKGVCSNFRENMLLYALIIGLSVLVLLDIILACIFFGRMKAGRFRNMYVRNYATFGIGSESGRPSVDTYASDVYIFNGTTDQATCTNSLIENWTVEQKLTIQNDFTAKRVFARDLKANSIIGSGAEPKACYTSQHFVCEIGQFRVSSYDLSELETDDLLFTGLIKANNVTARSATLANTVYCTNDALIGTLLTTNMQCKNLTVSTTISASEGCNVLLDSVTLPKKPSNVPQTLSFTDIQVNTLTTTYVNASNFTISAMFSPTKAVPLPSLAIGDFLFNNSGMYYTSASGGALIHDATELHAGELTAKNCTANVTSSTECHMGGLFVE